MVETHPTQIWAMRLTYVTLTGGALFVQLLPLSTSPANWTGPDLILALTFAWALRRPEFIPAFLVASVMLFADIVLHRPPGLVAVITLLATEWLKTRVLQVRNEGFVTELLLVASALIMVALAARVVMAVLLIPFPPLGLTAMQVAMTLAFYPLIVLASNLIFRVRARAPGDDATGGQLH